MKTAFKRISIMVLAIALVFTFVSAGEVHAASKLKAPKISKWKDVTYKYANSGGDGEAWQVTWKKVKGAKGYQIKYYEKEDPSGNWYTYTKTTKKCKAEIQFSSLSRFKVKVRAYKIGKNGKKEYGKWGISKVKKISY
ncbi:MAG TPA: hypothetical protein DF613_01785 [Lachnospiraceae bacterium]|nr:hypothetical protein [Lachnospiraceae bacterium]